MSLRKAVFLFVLASAAWLLSLFTFRQDEPFSFSRFLASVRPETAATQPASVNLKPASLTVPILLYHYIEDNTDERDFIRTSIATRPYFFDLQMKYLSTHGYTSIYLSELKSALEGKSRLPERPVIITFDDGFRDYYENAFPILKKYNLRAIVYMIANHIGRSGNLTVEMIKEMVGSGIFELGSHTLNHASLARVDPTLARQEIFESRRVLSETFNLDVKHFSYPDGSANEEVVQLVREAGYETAVSTKVGLIQTLEGLLTLKRLRVGNLGSGEFAALLEGQRIKE